MQMKMIREVFDYYCDLCGKQLTQDQYAALKIYDNRGNIVGEGEVCRNCMPRLERFLNMRDTGEPEEIWEEPDQAAAGSSKDQDTAAGSEAEPEQQKPKAKRGGRPKGSGKRKEVTVSVPPVEGKAKVDKGKIRALAEADWEIRDIAIDCHCSEQTVMEVLGEAAG